MSQAERIVVVGAGLAGLRAAERLRELGFSGELVMIGSEALPPYHRPALSKQLLAGAMRPGDLMLPAYQEIGAKWRLGTSAKWLSTHNRVLHLPGNEELGYDGLIIATGVEALRPNNVPYHDSRIMTMRTLPDALNLERAIAANRGPVAVVGGGFTGCEIAASLRHMGREVTLIGRSPSLLGNVLGAKLGGWLTGLHRDHGVDLALGTSVTDWQPSSDGIGLYLSDGTSLLAGCVVIAAGTTPSTGWLRGSGLPLDNGVVCEATCHVVGADDVVAAGDVAQWPNIRFDTVPRRIEHWLNAVEMGRAAAESLMAGRAAAEPFTPMPRFWTEQYGVRIQAAGVPKLGTDTITLGTRNDGTGTVMGYVRAGKLMGVVGLDCPSSILTWTETICQQNPSPTDPIPADPETAAPGRGGRGPRHSLPPKPKRTRSKQPTYGRLATLDSSARLRPADSSGRPADSNARLRPADSSPGLHPADSNTRIPSARNGFRPADSNGHPRPAETNGRLRPAESNSGFRPAGSNGQLRAADSSAGFRPADSSARLRPAESNSGFRPAEPNGHLRPAESNSGFRPAGSNGHLRAADPSAGIRPTDSNARLRPAESNPGFRPADTNGHLRPAESNPGFRPAGSNGHLRPADSSAGFRPADSDTRPARNGFRPTDSNPRLRPADSNAGFRPADSNPGFGPVDSNPGFRPVESNARMRPAIPPDPRPTPPPSIPNVPPAASNSRIPPARNGSTGRRPADQVDLSARFGPNASNPRLRPATNGFAQNGHSGPATNSSIPPARNGFPYPGPTDSSGRLRPAARNGHPGPRESNGRTGRAESSTPYRPPINGFGPATPRNGHSKPADENTRFGPAEFNAQLPGSTNTNGHSVNGTLTNGHSNGHTNGKTNGKTNGHHAPAESNGRLRPLDIYDRFATGVIPPVEPDVTGWIPRVDARKPHNHSR